MELVYKGYSRSLDMPADGHALLHPAERGYVHLIPGQATSQEVALGESVKLQVHIKAYPRLHQWVWEHTNPLKNSKAIISKDQMISGNNWYVLFVFYTGYGMFPRELSLRQAGPILQKTLWF